MRFKITDRCARSQRESSVAWREWYPGREMLIARVQYAVLQDHWTEETLEVGWHVIDFGKGFKLRSGPLTWPNVRESRHEGRLFARPVDDRRWYTVKSDWTNQEICQALADVGSTAEVAEVVRMLLERGIKWS